MKKLLLIGCSLMVAVSVGCTSNQAEEKQKEAKMAAKTEMKKVAKKEAPKCVKQSKAIEDADKARKLAASVGGEWRDTAKFLKKAKAHVKKGNCVEASQLANKALMEAQLGYDQAQSQKVIKMPNYFNFK